MAPAFDLHRIEEVLVQVVDILAARDPRCGRPTETKSIIARCWTYSQRPTPPAWGQTGTPNFAASSSTASASLTPPRRQESTWQKSSAPACMSCLKITRFWHISPVATPMPAASPPARSRHGPARRRGSSAPRSRRVESARAPSPTRSPPPHPSTGWRPHEPTVRADLLAHQHGAARVVRRRSRPTLILKASIPGPRPPGRDGGPSRRSSPASRPTSCKPESRPPAARRRASPRRLRSRIDSASSGVSASRDVAEIDEADESPRASSRRRGARPACPARRAQRSQSALTRAAVARWMTPFSGPTQRSWNRVEPIEAPWRR